MENLKKKLTKYNSAIIAFSGGVDSTFLAKVAKDIINKLLLVTIVTDVFSKDEESRVDLLAKELGIELLKINYDIFTIENFSKNPIDRCYHCKKTLFEIIQDIAKEKGYDTILDGSNFDDIKDYRPGAKALLELNIVSPLKDACFTKAKIREESKKLNLSTHNIPSLACFASRIPYEEIITKDKLKRIELCEKALRELNFKQIRVRSHQNLARIELDKRELKAGFEAREKINRICKDAGFSFVTLDLTGYRTGSLNETIVD